MRGPDYDASVGGLSTVPVNWVHNRKCPRAASTAGDVAELKLGVRHV